MSTAEQRLLYLQDKAREASEGPGVYRMLDKHGKILYIGKAKNLTNRIRTYFHKNVDDPKTKTLVGKIAEFEIILTNSEAEALILESIQIKKHKPRYNILLRDDKSYPFVIIDESHSFPKLVYMRRPKKRKGMRIFGPFASAGHLREAMRFLNKNFRLRDCSDSEFQNRSRPCLNYQIGTCSAPCTGMITAEDYQRDLNHALELLSGHGSDAIKKMEAEMEKLAEEMEFEKAARLRDLLKGLQETLQRKKSANVSNPIYGDIRMDVVGWHRVGASASVALLFVRGGDVVDTASFHFDHVEDRSNEEILTSFLAQFYLAEDQLEEPTFTTQSAFPGAEAKSAPNEILIPFDLPEQNLFEEGFAQMQTNTKFFIPQKGGKHDLLELAAKNAANIFEERQREKGSIYRVLADLRSKLQLENYPRRIECFDISNLGDTGIVASRVTFIEGKADKSLYRHYKMKSIDSQNDFAAMREVISRRLLKSSEYAEENFEDPPDLLIIDGGKGQLSMAVEVVKELNITGIDVVSLAKSKVESDFDNREVTRTFERVFKPGRMNPITLAPESAVCHLMQRIRDEAHRFAVEFQRKQRKNY